MAWMPFGKRGYYLDQRVTSHNQTGGITAHTVNLAPQDRALDAALRTQLLQMLPRDRLMKIRTPLGDGEAMRLSVEIWDFLAGEGFQMSEGGIQQAVFAVPPRGQMIDLESEAGVAMVIIGHRAG